MIFMWRSWFKPCQNQRSPTIYVCFGRKSPWPSEFVFKLTSRFQFFLVTGINPDHEERVPTSSTYQRESLRILHESSPTESARRSVLFADRYVAILIDCYHFSTFVLKLLRVQVKNSEIARWSFRRWFRDARWTGSVAGRRTRWSRCPLTFSIRSTSTAPRKSKTMWVSPLPA